MEELILCFVSYNYEELHLPFYKIKKIKIHKVTFYGEGTINIGRK